MDSGGIAGGRAGQVRAAVARLPSGGALFKRSWFPIVAALPVDVVARCRFWDCAATANGGDWTVGVKMVRTREGRFIVEDVRRGQWSAGDVERIMRQTAQADGPRVRIREEQEPGSAGKAVIAARTRLLAGFDYRGEPATGDKIVRWRPVAAQAEAGNVSVLQGVWMGAWLDELTVVPVGRHDDQADATAGAFADLALNASTVTVRKLSGF